MFEISVNDPFRGTYCNHRLILLLTRELVKRFSLKAVILKLF